MDPGRDEEAPQPLAQLIEAELGPAGERDQREGERVHGSEAPNRDGVDHVEHVWTCEHAREQVTRQVREAEQLDQLAEERAGEQEEADRADQGSVAVHRGAVSGAHVEDADDGEQARCIAETVGCRRLAR